MWQKSEKYQGLTNKCRQKVSNWGFLALRGISGLSKCRWTHRVLLNHSHTKRKVVGSFVQHGEPSKLCFRTVHDLWMKTGKQTTKDQVSNSLLLSLFHCGVFFLWILASFSSCRCQKSSVWLAVIAVPLSRSWQSVLYYWALRIRMEQNESQFFILHVVAAMKKDIIEHCKRFFLPETNSTTSHQRQHQIYEVSGCASGWLQIIHESFGTGAVSDLKLQIRNGIPFSTTHFWPFYTCMHHASASVSDACDLGDIRPDAENCSVFYECVGGGLVRQSCPEGLSFNHVRLLCDVPGTRGSFRLVKIF